MPHIGDTVIIIYMIIYAIAVLVVSLIDAMAGFAVAGIGGIILLIIAVFTFHDD